MYFKMFLYIIFLVWHGSNVFHFSENAYRARKKGERQEGLKVTEYRTNKLMFFTNFL